MHLDEKKINSELIYEGKIITVIKDEVVLENGEQAFREVVLHNGGVCVVPLTKDKEVIFVKQYRYPFATTLLEVPAGKLEKGEDPLECGKRELEEEAGVKSDNIISLGVMYPTTGYVSEKIYMYLAKDLEQSVQKLDADEFLDVVKIPLKDALNMVLNDEINDAKTQIAILKTAIIEKIN